MADLTIGNTAAKSNYTLLFDAALKIKNGQLETNLVSDSIPPTSTAITSEDIRHSQAASVAAVHAAINTAIISAMRASY